jgi:putative transposase
MIVKPIRPKMIAGGYAKIEELIKKEKNARIKDRLRAIYWKFKKISNAEIARRLNCDPHIITGWIKKWNKGGPEGLADKPRSGRPRKLNNEEEKEIIEGVKKKTINIGQHVKSC